MRCGPSQNRDRPAEETVAAIIRNIERASRHSRPRRLQSRALKTLFARTLPPAGKPRGGPGKKHLARRYRAPGSRRRQRDSRLRLRASRPIPSGTDAQHDGMAPRPHSASPSPLICGATIMNSRNAKLHESSAPAWDSHRHRAWSPPPTRKPDSGAFFTDPVGQPLPRQFRLTARIGARRKRPPDEKRRFSGRQNSGVDRIANCCQKRLPRFQRRFSGLRVWDIRRQQFPETPARKRLARRRQELPSCLGRSLDAHLRSRDLGHLDFVNQNTGHFLGLPFSRRAAIRARSVASRTRSSPWDSACSSIREG